MARINSSCDLHCEPISGSDIDVIHQPSVSCLPLFSIKKTYRYFTSWNMKMEFVDRNSKKLLATVCFCGIFFSYLINGILVEIVSRGKAFQFYTSISFVLSVVNTILARTINVIKHDQNDEQSHVRQDHQFKSMNQTKQAFENIPIYLLAICSMCYVISTTCANAALAYINYPTQVLGKSTKPIAILFMNIVLVRKKYSVRKCLSIFLVVLGITLFMIENKRIKPQEGEAINYSGTVLILFSLMFDSFMAAAQEKMRSSYKLNTYGLMFKINFWASIFQGMVIIISGEIWPFMNYCYNLPKTFLHLVGLSITGALGQNFIFLTITNFGPLTCSLITTTRKFFTILLSTMLFNNLISSLQWFYVFVVFGGLVSDVFS